jgi:hypothetical protein
MKIAGAWVALPELLNGTPSVLSGGSGLRPKVAKLGQLGRF